MATTSKWRKDGPGNYWLLVENTSEHGRRINCTVHLYGSKWRPSLYGGCDAPDVSICARPKPTDTLAVAQVAAEAAIPAMRKALDALRKGVV